jgi:AcrR family transcriptional regulator
MSTRKDKPRSGQVRPSVNRPRRKKRKEPDEVIWMREEPGARRAGLSREQIGKTAVKIADAEGFEAVSMRRLAKELDAGTMTLYHYVRNKAELLSLMWNHVMADLVVPEKELSGDWRRAVSKLARVLRRTIKEHPWVFESMSQPAGSGPNGLRYFEQQLAAVNELNAPPRDRMELVGLVDDYVFGFTLRELLQEMYEAEGDPDMTESALAFFESELETGEYPNMSKLFGGDVGTAMGRLMENFSGEKAADRRFERGLKALLDGFEANLPKPRKR